MRPLCCETFLAQSSLGITWINNIGIPLSWMAAYQPVSFNEWSNTPLCWLWISCRRKHRYPFCFIYEGLAFTHYKLRSILLMSITFALMLSDVRWPSLKEPRFKLPRSRQFHLIRLYYIRLNELLTRVQGWRVILILTFLCCHRTSGLMLSYQRCRIHAGIVIAIYLLKHVCAQWVFRRFSQYFLNKGDNDESRSSWRKLETIKR